MLLVLRNLINFAPVFENLLLKNFTIAHNYLIFK